MLKWIYFIKASESLSGRFVFAWSSFLHRKAQRRKLKGRNLAHFQLSVPGLNWSSFGWVTDSKIPSSSCTDCLCSRQVVSALASLRQLCLKAHCFLIGWPLETGALTPPLAARQHRGQAPLTDPHSLILIKQSHILWRKKLLRVSWRTDRFSRCLAS